MSLALKLSITPIAIAAITVLARRGGSHLGGWLAAIPFTSAPVVLALALEHGESFAGMAAIGVLAGTASQAAFALAYPWTALRLPWPASLLAASALFAACTWALNTLALTVGSALMIVVGAIVLALTLMPRRAQQVTDESPDQLSIRVDAVLRAAIATAMVLTITTVAPRIGAGLAGLVSPFPVFAALFLVFPHARHSTGAVLATAYTFLLGLFVCTAFFSVLASLLGTTPLAVAYLLAVTAALIAYAITRVAVRLRQARQARV
jgi:hypothetical protein